METKQTQALCNIKHILNAHRQTPDECIYRIEGTGIVHCVDALAYCSALCMYPFQPHRSLTYTLLWLPLPMYWYSRTRNYWRKSWCVNTNASFYGLFVKCEFKQNIQVDLRAALSCTTNPFSPFSKEIYSLSYEQTPHTQYVSGYKLSYSCNSSNNCVSLSFEQHKSTRGSNAAQDAEFVFRHQITWFIVITDRTRARVFAQGDFVSENFWQIFFFVIIINENCFNNYKLWYLWSYQ